MIDVPVRNAVIESGTAVPRPVLPDGLAGLGDLELAQNVSRVLPVLQIQPIDHLAPEPGKGHHSVLGVGTGSHLIFQISTRGGAAERHGLRRAAGLRAMALSRTASLLCGSCDLQPSRDRMAWNRMIEATTAALRDSTPLAMGTRAVAVRRERASFVSPPASEPMTKVVRGPQATPHGAITGSVGPNDLHKTFKMGIEIAPAGAKNSKKEMSAHPRAHDLPKEGVDGAPREDHQIEARGCRAAKNRARVAGIGNSIEDENQCLAYRWMTEGAAQALAPP